ISRDKARGNVPCRPGRGPKNRRRWTSPSPCGEGFHCAAEPATGSFVSRTAPRLGYKAPVFLLKKLLASLILPPTGLVLLAFAGLAISIRRRRLGLAIVSLALAAIVVLSLRPVAYALNRSLEDAPPLSQQALDRAQAIVILGGGTYPDTPEFGGDMLNAFSLERTHYGVFLQRRSGLPILVTGGSPYGGKAEADLMKEVIERDFRGEV